MATTSRVPDADEAGVTPAPGRAGAAPSDADVMAWVERHDLRIGNVTDARCAFEDAATLWLVLRYSNAGKEKR